MIYEIKEIFFSNSSLGVLIKIFLISKSLNSDFVFANQSNSDLFGHSVAISDDSKTIVAGAINNSENALFSGHARVYRDDSDCLGCTDPSSINFDPNATADDGSCITCFYGCIDPLAENFVLPSDAQRSMRVYEVKKSPLWSDLRGEEERGGEKFIIVL